MYPAYRSLSYFNPADRFPTFIDFGRLRQRVPFQWTCGYPEFPEGSADSLLEVVLGEIEGGTKLTLRHSEIPDGRAGSYKKGWTEHYFEPMTAHFGQR